MSFYNDIELLIDGKNAFPSILECINNATKNIRINMFIWRDDEIGNKIGEAVLNAANRGVKVYISKDRYGVVLEKSEETKKSFFHKTQTLSEKIKINTLELIYPMSNTPKKELTVEEKQSLEIESLKAKIKRLELHNELLKKKMEYEDQMEKDFQNFVKNLSTKR